MHQSIHVQQSGLSLLMSIAPCYIISIYGHFNISIQFSVKCHDIIYEHSCYILRFSYVTFILQALYDQYKSIHLCYDVGCKLIKYIEVCVTVYLSIILLFLHLQGSQIYGFLPHIRSKWILSISLKPILSVARSMGPIP